jgi:hypothetical protein
MTSRNPADCPENSVRLDLALGALEVREKASPQLAPYTCIRGGFVATTGGGGPKSRRNHVVILHSKISASWQSVDIRGF